MSNGISFSELIIRATGGENPTMTIKEIARAMRVHEQTVYSYKDDRSEPSYSKILDLNDEMMRKGFYSLSMQFMPNGGKGKANGTLDDDAARMMQLMGKLYDASNKAEYQNIIAEMEQVVRDFSAEMEEVI